MEYIIYSEINFYSSRKNIKNLPLFIKLLIFISNFYCARQIIILILFSFLKLLFFNWSLSYLKCFIRRIIIIIWLYFFIIWIILIDKIFIFVFIFLRIHNIFCINFTLRSLNKILILYIWIFMLFLIPFNLLLIL